MTNHPISGVVRRVTPLSNQESLEWANLSPGVSLFGPAHRDAAIAAVAQQAVNNNATPVPKHPYNTRLNSSK